MLGLVLLALALAEAVPSGAREVGPGAGRVRVAARLRAAAPAEVVQVYVRLDATGPAALAALRAGGLAVEVVNAELGLVQGRITGGRLAGLAALAGVREIRPADRARPRAIVSAGDRAARADRARALGADGTGVVVGVLSDGIDGLAAAMAAGELPAVTVPPDPRCQPGAGDEGTAVLEIVHDLAPGAALLFAGASTSLEFIEAARCLADAGARVIVDDLGFIREPYFEDGPVARAVREMVQRGVVWVTAAGNDNLRHVDMLFQTGVCVTVHDFGSNCTNQLRVAPGETIDCVLQWNDPFGGSANDYALVFVDETLAVVDTSDDPQTGFDVPLEEIVWTNPDPFERAMGLRIRLNAGESRRLKLICHGGELERIVGYGSIVGHPAVVEAVAVGAIDVTDELLRAVEPFSGRGPVALYFPVETREKPDVAGFDAVLTSRPAFAPFLGTSAAAAHVAATAALILARNPFLPPARVQEVLRTSAVDLGPPGVDNAYGAGRLDALAALQAVPVPECLADATCDPTGTCPLDACGGGTCAESAVGGLGLDACAALLVPRTIAKRFAQACRHAAHATRARRPAAASRHWRQAGTALTRATRAVDKAVRRGLAVPCAGAIATHLSNARARLPAP